MGVENLDFPEAVRWLAQRAGMTVPEDGVDDSNALSQSEINRETARFYYKMLSAPEGKPGLDYFRRRRGWTTRPSSTSAWGIPPTAASPW